MPEQIKITDIQAIAYFRNQLNLFEETNIEVFNRILNKLGLTKTELYNKMNYWHFCLDEAESDVEEAQHELDNCLSDEDNVCSKEEERLEKSKKKLNNIKIILENVIVNNNKINIEIEKFLTIFFKTKQNIVDTSKRGLIYLDSQYGTLIDYISIVNSNALYMNSNLSAKSPIGSKNQFAEKYFNEDLFVDDPHSSDIHQGNIGDCYFLAPLGAIANQNPDFIRDMVKDNEDGTYTVRFYEEQKDGAFKPIYVTVDNSLLVDSISENPVYAKTNNDNSNGMWVSIVEKAYAEWQGGYEHIDGGKLSDALSQLTGQNAEENNCSNVTWSSLKESFNKGQVISVAKYNQKGEIPGLHGYSVVNLNKREGREYITLKNPWGDAGLKYGDQFEMKYSDFIENFEEICLTDIDEV